MASQIPMASHLTLPPLLVDQAVMAALEEDLGQAGDITTDAIIPEDAEAEVSIVTRESGIIAGLDLAEAAFTALDPYSAFERLVDDGQRAAPGQSIARIDAKTRAILSGERVALNFLGRMSGIATLTAAFVAAVEGTGAAIVDTRKTAPGLRPFDKYAVRAGGGRNHRFGLYDAVLIKDNHIAAAGGLSEAVGLLKHRIGHSVKIEVEVESLDQLNEALALPIDAVLLDNMDIATLKRAVALVGGKLISEASGGVTLESVKAIAETGVDLISIGALTHSPKNLDLSIEWRP